MGLLLFKAIAAIVDSLDALSAKYSSPDNLLRFYDRLKDLVPFFKRCLEAAIYVCMATLAIEQLELISNFTLWALRISKIVGLVFISRVLVEIAHLVVEELLLKNQNLTELHFQAREMSIQALYLCHGGSSHTL